MDAPPGCFPFDFVLLSFLSNFIYTLEFVCVRACVDVYRIVFNAIFRETVDFYFISGLVSVFIVCTCICCSWHVNRSLQCV